MWTALLLGDRGRRRHRGLRRVGVARGGPRHRRRGSFVVGYPFAYLAVPLFFTAFWFMLAWWFRARRPADDRAWRSRRASRCSRASSAALARSAPRMILYRWLVPDPPPAPAALPVLLLHGVGCNAGVWAGMRRHLAERGVAPVYALSYGPPLALDRSLRRPARGARSTPILAATGARAGRRSSRTAWADWSPAPTAPLRRGEGAARWSRSARRTKAACTRG